MLQHALIKVLTILSECIVFQVLNSKSESPNLATLRGERKIVLSAIELRRGQNSFTPRLIENLDLIVGQIQL